MTRLNRALDRREDLRLAACDAETLSGRFAPCDGGWLAVEVARELKQAGAELAFVGLIDTGFESDPLPSKLLNKARTLAQAIRSFPQWYNEERRGQTHGQVVRGIASKLSQRARTLVTNERSSITNV
ncbi:MAG: hypothetical protein ACK46A_13105, partial [Akkermansiaceae bacterium]